MDGSGDGRSKWEAASKARAVGVVAMDQLLSRLKKTTSERDLLDANCAKLQGALSKVQDEHSTLLERQKGWVCEFVSLRACVYMLGFPHRLSR